MMLRWTSATFRAACAALLPLLAGGCPVGGDLLDVILGGNGGAPNEPAPPQAPTAKVNTPPVVDAGGDQSVRAGELVVLNAARTRDADGDPMMFIWQQIDGDARVELENPFASIALFDAPVEVGAPTVLTFRVTVIDGTVAVTQDVRVEVRPP